MFFLHPKSESDPLKFVHLKIREQNLTRLMKKHTVSLSAESAPRRAGSAHYEFAPVEFC